VDEGQGWVAVGMLRLRTAIALRWSFYAQHDSLFLVRSLSDLDLGLMDVTEDRVG
jgi:hypothetical protein